MGVQTKVLATSRESFLPNQGSVKDEDELIRAENSLPANGSDVRGVPSLNAVHLRRGAGEDARATAGQEAGATCCRAGRIP
jgi:hypothetical protein